MGFDPVTAQQAAAQAKDYAGRPLKSFLAYRDLPSIIGHYDSSVLTGADGATVEVWPDVSGQGQDLQQTTSVNRPTLATYNGKKIAHCAGAVKIIRPTSTNNTWPPRGTSFAQPITHIVLCRTASSVSANRCIVAGNAATSVSLRVNSNNIVSLDAGGASITGGPNVADDQWHVLAAVAGTTYAAAYVDGFAVASASAQTGTNALGGYALGSLADTGGQPYTGDIAEVLTFQGALTSRQILNVTKALAAKWGITLTVPAKNEGVTYKQTTSGNGQSVRVWYPGTPKVANGKTPLLLWSHQAGLGAAAEQVIPGNFAYHLAHAAVNEGWIFAASNQHSATADQWGNDTAVADNLDLYNLVNGVLPVGPVVLIGASMGGLSTATMVALQTLGAGVVTGAYFIDAALSLSDVYAPANGTSNFSTNINTAYSVASYAAIPAGHDPMVRPASDFGSTRMRFVASTADTVISKTANTDAFRTKVASTATESALVTHVLGHLGQDSAQPADLITFAKRCGC